jgi:hypothetical protein
MLNKKIRILNFDDSVTRQKGLLSRYEAGIIDMRDLGPRARFWMKRGDRREIERRIPAGTPGAVTFLGSGDFHHVTDILIRQHDEPISVIDFDFHPDWDTIFPLLHCGSWVAHGMGNRDVLKLVMIGASSRDLSLFSLQTGDLDSLKNDRIEIYPYSCRPAAVFFRNVPPNISLETKKYPFFTRIYWNELKNKNIMEFFLHLIRRLPTKKVYVTVDKDCLGTADSLTNWDQGILSLDDLLVMLKMIKENLDIIGMDIAGDYSPIRIDGVFKNIVSRLDHPRKVKAAELPGSAVAEVNERTNLKILDLIAS